MNKPKTRNENIVVQEMNGELLIYDLKENKAFCLNETSALIYQLCDGTRNIKEILQSFNQTAKQSINDELIWLALDRLKKENLLEENGKFEIDFKGLNRRQVVKKIGLASMIALPLVSSIVAPSAAMAASGAAIALLGACPTGSGCASGLTCRTCSGGTCNGQQVCCAGDGLFGPGFVNRTGVGFGTCTPSSAQQACIVSFRHVDCCTGSVIGTNCVNNGNGTFTTNCTCA